ncbi:MAG: GFA family protein [Marinomonas sp.]
MTDQATGGCLCGAVKYEFPKDQVLAAHHCHCTDCQKSTGSGKATIVIVPTAAMQSSGDLKYFTVTGKDGSHVSRGFCPECGSPIMSRVEEMAAINIIKAGSLDQSDWVQVTSSFWSDTAQAWSPVDADLPSCAANPQS